MRKLLPLGALLVLLALGQTTARADEKSHRKAAEELLKTMDMEKTLEATIDQMLDVQIKQNPAIAPYKNVMKRFFAKYYSYASLKDDFIKLYTDEFTEAELKDLNAFYQTPLGKKLTEKTPKLSAKGAQIGMERVQANQAELQKMIMEEMEKKKP